MPLYEKLPLLSIDNKLALEKAKNAMPLDLDRLRRLMETDLTPKNIYKRKKGIDFIFFVFFLLWYRISCQCIFCIV